ncbi:hypothetical protein AJ80_05493 [Polytolypa hystricis UAMH7299]|uniref:Uncharacterized protein n=1 Tax=Polytolypa hystricis (strain UAMH7299) TaxID=1447883 RepID=A0A2B7Y469_POLH7|nr:hypothetical protein AJ80_05493 [Polytolypa hystricis UAMH7299]
MVLILNPVVAFCGGISSHLFFFKRGERHLHPERYIQAFFLAFVVSVVYLMRFHAVTLGSAVYLTAKIAALYLSGLYSSLVVFRLFLNPLNKFPGPFWARLSSFTLVYNVGKKKNGHYHFQNLHKKYGRIVRIGPNDLSITDADCVEVVSSAKSKCTRAPFYSQAHPITSLHVTRDPMEHAQRRRVWSKAFSENALRGYEARVQRYNEQLIEQIGASCGQPIDMTKWFNFYSFDVMGDLGFGQSFGMLGSGGMHWAIQVLQEGIGIVGCNLPSWAMRLLHAIPKPAGARERFKKFFIQQLDNRIKLQGKLDALDISHYLIEHFNNSDPLNQTQLVPMLQGDSRLIIIAGSDTTAVTLTHLFYYLTTVTGLQDRLRQEIAEHTDDDGTLSNRKLQSAPMLNACINETLRMHPPVASGAPRKTPTGGVHLRDIWIPANTAIQMPWYVMGRDPEYFPHPDEFIPERFSTRSELVTHKDAWGPFNVGPYNCIGKNLAYMEIRGLTSQLLTEFDVSLAPGEDGKELLYNAKDHFTLGLRPFHLVFSKRKV